MSDKKPNLFIVGAAKAGTTSLHKYLDQHPDIYMAPIKEPHHFSSDINFEEFNENYKQQVRFDLKRYLTQKRLTNKHIAFIEDKEKYLELFREANNEKYFGEGSNGYLYSKVAAKEICDFNPHARIIILLRNPVDRAFSHWLMDFRNTDNDIGNFVEALEADYKGKYKGWGVSHLYVELGRYSNQVKRYLDNFPKEQIKIFLYEDFRKNNLHVLNDIFRFLGVEEKNKLEKITSNKASVPKNRRMIQILKSTGLTPSKTRFFPQPLLRFIKMALYDSQNLPVLSKAERDYVFKKYFKSDVDKLEKLVNLDFDKWSI